MDQSHKQEITSFEGVLYTNSWSTQVYVIFYNFFPTKVELPIKLKFMWLKYIFLSIELCMQMDIRFHGPDLLFSDRFSYNFDVCGLYWQRLIKGNSDHTY